MSAKPRSAPKASLYTMESYRVGESVGFLISKARWMLMAALDREAESLDVSAAQGAMLLLIAAGKGDTAAELAREIEYDSGSMTRMLDRLEAKCLIRRQRSGHDRRRVSLSLTPEGRRLARRLPAIAVNVLNRHLGEFSRKELRLFESFLKRMLAARENSPSPARANGNHL